MGDSQTWNVYYALECLMREFAPDLQRRWGCVREPGLLRAACCLLS